MTDYVDKVLKEALSYMVGTATTPADKNLFEARDNIAGLPTDNAKFFHAMVARLLFLCKRGRPDQQTAIAFLCIPGYNKHQLSMINANSVASSNICARVVAWYSHCVPASSVIDAAFAFHCGMRSHTGGVMSMGARAIYLYLQKQKMNTKSLTEARTNYFVEAQG
jgi:hypothetical protein